jgi:CheY-like chemotaxis protein
MEARNGRTALTIVNESRLPIDALLTDLRLPDIGGLDLARQARSAQAGCPILFMSGGPPPTASLPGQVLRKPFDEVTLRRALLSLMRADPPPE